MYTFPLANVFIDSTVVIRSKYDFHNGDLLRLKQYSDIGMIQLVTSSIVVREVKAHIAQDVTEFTSTLVKTIRKNCPIHELRYLDDSHKFLFENFALLNWKDYILDKWDHFLSECECKILNSREVNPEDVLEDYFLNIPPFEARESKKQEFPDAFSIKSLVLNSEQFLGKIFVFTHDNGWANAFPVGEITASDGSTREFVVVDDLNEIVKSIFETNNPKMASRILSSLDLLKETIVVQVRADIQSGVVPNDPRNIELINFDFDYDAIFKVEVEDVSLEFDTFESLEDDCATLIFDVNCCISVSYRYTDYFNSAYDPEDKVFLHLKQCFLIDTHENDMSIRVNLKSVDAKNFSILGIEYPYKLLLSKETVMDSNELSENNIPAYLLDTSYY